jgi:glycosyltransferase involved in cell wall biosynthesis
MIEIISATRLPEGEFWKKSALGLSLRRLATNSRIVPRIAFENRRGLAEVYNARIDAADGDAILVFIHDDVWLDEGAFAERVAEGLATFDIIGVAGNRRRVWDQPAWAFIDEQLTWDARANLSGSVAHGAEPSGAVSVYGAAPAACELLDGVFLAAERSKLKAAGVRFDPRFDFDFDDMAFCRSARERGLRPGTWPIRLTHQSGQPFGGPRWQENRLRYREKWGELRRPPGGGSRICFAIADDEYSFYRTFLPASELAKRGFNVSVIKQPDLATLLSFDTAVFETPFTDRHYDLFRRLKGKVRLVLDLDDNFHEIERSNPRSGAFAASRALITRAVESADELIVATEPLKDFYAAFNDRITVLPNMIPPQLFLDQSPRPAPSAQVRIGWHGGFSHNADLRILETVFPVIRKEFPDAHFVFFGNAPSLNIPDAEYVGPVPYAAFPAALASLRLDIGVAPLRDTPFNRCKSNLKWLEYSALGIPAVVSDVLPYSRSIEHGVNGFLVKTPEDWVRELGRLIRDPALRRAVGRRARESAVERFGCEAVGARYAELAGRWPVNSSALVREPLDSRPWGVDVFLVSVLGMIAALVPVLMILPAVPAAMSRNMQLLGAVILSQLLTIAAVAGAIRACFATHRIAGAFQPAAGRRDAKRGLAEFFAFLRLRIQRRRASTNAIFPASVLAIAGLIPLEAAREQNHPLIAIALPCAILAEGGILALIYALAYYLTSRRFTEAEVLPLESFIRP